jgi:hypothetical protein
MTKVEELRAELEKDIAVDAIGHHVYGDVADDIDFLIAAAKEEERERIRSLATPIDDYASQMSLVIPYTALSPAPKEKP